MKYLSEFRNKNLSNKICLLRVDFNIKDNELNKNNLRIRAVLPTINFLLDRGAKIVILSHRGRPQNRIKEFSLRPFVKILSRLLDKPVHFIDFDRETNFIKKEDIPKINASIDGSIFLLENLRFLKGEEKNDKKFAKQLASLGDFYVNDAFAVSHRKNASVCALTRYLPSYAGLLLEKELKNLLAAMKNKKKPFIIILGGAKISDRIGLIGNFLNKADYFLIGGGMANTFLAAQDLPVGDSLYEKNKILTARQLLKFPHFNQKIILPVDLIIKKRQILDIGSETIKKYAEIIKNAKTIIWNGPLGYIEDKKFRKGSEEIASAIIKSRAFSIIGGGETISLFKLKNKNLKLKTNIFLSTGGGAMLEYLSGKKLPSLKTLR